MAATLLWSVPGCGDDAATKTTRNPYEGVTIGDEQLADSETAADWGDDWVGRMDQVATPGAAGRTTEWTIVLGTFGTGAHQQAAATMVRDLPRIAPELSAARVHTTEKGSMVVYGVYDGPQSDAAQEDLAWVKGLLLAERVVFPRAMLTRVHLDDPLRMHPYHLMSGRRRYPNVDPLYTLQIASWGDFDSGELTVKEIHAASQAYVEQLRAQGVEAYFYHDDDKMLSIVTVGLFDQTAIDRRSGFYAPHVMEIIKRYPAHLVNGEPLNEMVDVNRPRLGTKVQMPRLVHVPE